MEQPTTRCKDARVANTNARTTRAPVCDARAACACAALARARGRNARANGPPRNVSKTYTTVCSHIRFNATRARTKQQRTHHTRTRNGARTLRAFAP
eukprot:5228723-Lingulodinium_polyedra.AAC.1